jgi:hypothetical protein
MKSEKTSGKNFIPSRPGGVAQHVGHELVGHFRRRLEPARNDRAAGGRQQHERRDQRDGGDHEQGGVREAEVEAADIAEIDDVVDGELVDGVDPG